jgi:hypothetical protein
VKILQEITDWDTPNHIYHVADNGKLVAYQPVGSDQVTTFTVPLTFSRTGRKFRTLEVVSEKPQGIQVQGSKGQVYTILDGRCNCPGFTFRGHCKHIDQVA